MKKTFQKELKTAPGRRAEPNHQNGFDDISSLDHHENMSLTQSEDRRTPIEFLATSSSAMSPFSSSKGAGLNHSLLSVSIEDELSNNVDVQYLKHVIFKFLTSKEYEVTIK